MTEYPITFSEFKNWLETKSPTEIVGRRLCPDDCPLQRCASELLDKRVIVGRGVMFVDDELFNPPGWATAFVLGVDQPGSYGSNVTARTALRLLGRVEASTLPDDEQDAEALRLESEVVRG